MTALLLALIYLTSADTLTGKVKHGAWSAYFNQLAREDLERKAQAQGVQHAN